MPLTTAISLKTNFFPFDNFSSIHFFFQIISSFFSILKVTVTAWHIEKRHQHKGISFLWFCLDLFFRNSRRFLICHLRRFRNGWNTFPIIYCINQTDDGCIGNLFFQRRKGEYQNIGQHCLQRCRRYIQCVTTKHINVFLFFFVFRVRVDFIHFKWEYHRIS